MAWSDKVRGPLGFTYVIIVLGLYSVLGSVVRDDLFAT